MAVVLGHSMSAASDKRAPSSAAEKPDSAAEQLHRVTALYRAKAEAELSAADAEAPGSDSVRWRGEPLADVVVVKGLPGPAEAAGGDAMSGADGEAAVAALEALGHDPAQTLFTLSRPEPGIDEAARVRRLRLQVEAADPAVVIAVDPEAAEDLACAFEVARLKFGTPVRVAGRTLVAADGLEASLGDQRKKAAVWHQLKAAKPEPPVY